MVFSILVAVPVCRLATRWAAVRDFDWFVEGEKELKVKQLNEKFPDCESL
jgi:hypothetical protein